MAATPGWSSPSDPRNKAVQIIESLKEEVRIEKAKSARLAEEFAAARTALETLRAESSAKITSLEKALASAHTTATDQAIAGDDEELEDLRAQLDEVTEENDALRLQVQQLKVSAANEGRLKRQLAIAEEEAKRMAGELEEMGAETQALRNDLEGEIQQLKQRLAAAPAAPAEFEKAAVKAGGGAQAEKELAALAAKLAEAEARAEESAAAQAQLSADFAKAKAEIAALKESAAGTEDQIAGLRDAGLKFEAGQAESQSSDKVAELERRLDDLMEQNEELKLRSAEAQKDDSFVVQLQQELKQKDHAISELAEQLSGKADAEALQAEVATLRRNVEELNAKLTKVSREYSDVKWRLRTTETEKVELLEQTKEPEVTPKPGAFEHEYVKKSLLQFFEQDNRTRGDLIPIILQFVGCRDEEIHNAMASWSRSHSSYLPSFARCLGHSPS
jgi:chromosome segregation ATPase